jgi:hypothetical protein
MFPTAGMSQIGPSRNPGAKSATKKYVVNQYLTNKKSKRGKFLGGWAWQGLGSVIHPMDVFAP